MMWPWGHLAFAYLVFAAYLRVRGRRPTEATALLVALGSQTPDLIDKPLAWTLPVLPSGRSLAHSLVVVGPLLGVAYLLARRRDRRREAGGETDGGTPATRRRRATAPLVGAFALGTVTHSLGDALYPLSQLNVEFVRFLAWPVLPIVGYDDGGFVAHIARLQFSPMLAFEFLLVAAAVVVWRADGSPGLATVRAWSTRLVRAVGQ